MQNKSFWQFIKSRCRWITNRDLIKQIIMNQKDEALALGALRTQLTKANGEIQAKLKALQDTIDNGPDVSPEVEAAVAELTKASQALDDVVPDAPPATP